MWRFVCWTDVSSLNGVSEVEQKFLPIELFCYALFYCRVCVTHSQVLHHKCSEKKNTHTHQQHRGSSWQQRTAAVVVNLVMARITTNNCTCLVHEVPREILNAALGLVANFSRSLCSPIKLCLPNTVTVWMKINEPYHAKSTWYWKRSKMYFFLKFSCQVGFCVRWLKCEIFTPDMRLMQKSPCSHNCSLT